MTLIRTLTLAALLTGTAAAPAAAQSLFSTRGLGVPVPAVDARAAALGGIGVGLIGFHTSLTNPAELAGVTQRGVSAAFQPVSTSFDVADAQDGTSGTRFPLMTIIYPFGQRLVGSIGYGSFLEQSWGVLTQSTQVVGGETYDVTDLLRSRGGIAQARVSAVYSLSPSLAVGAAGGLLTGNVQRVAGRVFTDTLGAQFRGFSEELRWEYRAPIGVVGVRWDIAGRMRLGASALFGGELNATGGTSRSDDRTYGAPLQVSAGASARLTPLMMVTAGTVWSRMPATDGVTLMQETLRVGGGIEYQGLRSGLRTYPLRLGGHWAQLPYYQQGENTPTEWGVAGGMGFRLGDPTNPAAVVDVGVERGGRTGLGSATLSTDLTESLWRFSVSLSLFAR
jgi:hypothetical protein